MLSREALQAYKDWKSTGDLVDNDSIVKELHDGFLSISDATVGIPEYEIVSRHANDRRYRLEDVIKAREERKPKPPEGNLHVVKFTESGRGWGGEIWYNSYDNWEDAAKAVSDCNKDLPKETPDYYIMAEYIGEVKSLHDIPKGRKF